MGYLLSIYFTYSVVAISYPTLEACNAAADYYHMCYGEEVRSTECSRLEDEI